MTDLPPFLKQELVSALQSCQNSHSSNINRDYLGLLLRVGKTNPDEVVPFIDILISNVSIHRSNLVSSLYGLITLADVNEPLKNIISSKLSQEQIDSYAEDGDKKVSGNAIILKEILAGGSLSDFNDETTKKEVGQTINHYHFNNSQISNSNLSINSPFSSQAVHIKNVESFDEDTKKLLEDLRDALNKKDKGKAQKILEFIADKSFDLFVAILAGKVLGS